MTKLAFGSNSCQRLIFRFAKIYYTKRSQWPLKVSSGQQVFERNRLKILSMHLKNSFLRHFLLVLSGLILACGCPPCLYADHDTALRTDLNFSYTFNEKFRGISYAYIQADDEMSNYDYAEWGIGLNYQLPLPWLSFQIQYCQWYTKDEGRSWALEQDPGASLNLRTKIGPFSIEEQILFEYRILPEWNDFRLKNILVISLPAALLTPYTGLESYYENREKALMLNRLKIGINAAVSRHISAGPYYRMDFSNVDHSWEWARQLIGVQLSINY